MGKLIGVIVGAISGYIGGLIVGFFCEIISCFMGGGIDGYAVAFFCAIIGAGIGLWVGHSSDKEKIEKIHRDKLAAEERNRQYLLAQEEQKRKESEMRFNDWCLSLDEKFIEIEDSNERNMPVGEAYQNIWNFENVSNAGYKNYYENAMSKHRSWLCERAADSLTKNRFDMRIALRKISLLKASYKNDPKFDPAINALKLFCDYIEDPQPKYISFGEYGNIILPLDASEEMDYMIANASAMLQKLVADMNSFADNRSGYFDGVVKYMNTAFICTAARLTWFYAKHKPFNINAFEKVRFILNKYTNTGVARSEENGVYWLESAEEILAVIYAKNQIGGKGTVEQEKKNIDVWLGYNENNPEECAHLASGLAWMELYDLERDVLRSMVQNKISMAPELQERLTLLESGNNMNINVYTIEDTDDFVYDSSAASWTANDMEVFFRKLGMKRMTLNYSLAVSEWKKTLPLTGGQKASMDQLYAEFQKVMLDFEGEVVCSKKTARAIDLDNVEYPDAVLFRFTSERSRGLTLMFSCEKFGRNLNITILTFFTPESGMDAEKMQKYAVSIKSNIYVESFIETLLQAVDEVLKERREIYDEGNLAESNSSKKIVE